MSFSASFLLHFQCNDQGPNIFQDAPNLAQKIRATIYEKFDTLITRADYEMLIVYCEKIEKDPWNSEHNDCYLKFDND